MLGQSPVPDATAQRIERASAGFAVSLPIGWEHQDAATYDEDWWDSDYGAPRRQHKRFITNGGKLRARTSRSFLTSHEQCYLYDWTDHAAEPPAWDSLDDAYAYYDSTSDDSDAIWTFAAYLDLPAGRAVHRDALHDSGWYWRDYLFTNDTTWFMLVCGAEDPPEDRWLSIAETFEFLPAEEWSGVAEPSPSAAPGQAAPREPLGASVEGGLIAMAGSGFAITFPGDWTVELADPDPDVFSVMPGTAWEALRATAHDGSMACSVVVAVATVPLRGSKTSQDGVAAPFWDPDEPDRLWVPAPDLPNTGSTHGTSWIRHQPQDDDLDRDVQYELLCAANNAVVSRPAPALKRLMETFEFLPAEE